MSTSGVDGTEVEREEEVVRLCLCLVIGVIGVRTRMTQVDEED